MSTWIFTLKLQLNWVNNNYLLAAQKSHFRFSTLTHSLWWLRNVFGKIGGKMSWKQLCYANNLQHIGWAAFCYLLFIDHSKVKPFELSLKAKNHLTKGFLWIWVYDSACWIVTKIKFGAHYVVLEFEDIRVTLQSKFLWENFKKFQNFWLFFNCFWKIWKLFKNVGESDLLLQKCSQLCSALFITRRSCSWIKNRRKSGEHFWKK